MSESTSFRNLFTTLVQLGDITSPRGQKTLEIENMVYVLGPRERFTSFEARKLNVPYIKKEFLWYLRGDRFDASITEHAKMWINLKQPDGGFNSNYGQYIFNKDCNQFDRIVEMLTKDKDSRRASMVILQPKHVLTDTTDQPCTYTIRFSIRRNRLGMTVHMRSQDAVFGMGNDAPCFSFIHEMVFVKLREVYPDLEMGNYTHTADSFHVYERHFEMLKEITGCGEISEDGLRAEPNLEKACPFDPVECPEISSGAEADFLIAGDFQNIPESFKFAQWLVS